MMTRENADDIVTAYLEDCYFEPLKNWPKIEFKRRCYQRAAAELLLERIWQSDPHFTEPLAVVRNFLREVRNYDRTSATKLIFDTLEETLVDLYDQLRASSGDI